MVALSMAVLRQGHRKTCRCLRFGWIDNKIYTVAGIRLLAVDRDGRGMAIIGASRQRRRCPCISATCVGYVTEQHRVAKDVVAGDIGIRQGSAISILSRRRPVECLGLDCKHQRSTKDQAVK